MMAKRWCVVAVVVAALGACNVALEEGPTAEPEDLVGQEGEATGALWTTLAYAPLSHVTPAPAALGAPVTPVLIRTAATFRRWVQVAPPPDLDFSTEMVVFHAAGERAAGSNVAISELVFSDTRTLKIGVALSLPGPQCPAGDAVFPYVLVRVARPDVAVRSVRTARAQATVDCTPPPPPPPPADALQQLLANPGAPVVEFQAGWRQAQHGLLVAGADMVVDFDPWRMTTCRNTHNGFPAWNIMGHARFLPGGETASASVRAFESPSGVPTNTVVRAPWRLPIPAGTTRVEFWFHNTAGAGVQCEAYDSNFGSNYVFDVVDHGATAVAWAGDWGGSFSRACTHQDGLQDPINIDSYVMQRACSFVDADVYVPLDGDVAPAHGVLAQVVFARDDETPVRAWLEPVGRVGNNQRFRWWLPRTDMGMLAWTRYSFSFRFSVDGVTWTSIAREDGTNRTVLRAF